MKIRLAEHGGCFSFEMEAETLADAAQLARLAVNGVKQVRGIYVHARTDLTMDATVVIAKRRRADSSLT